jgi:hypothetical protein
VSSFVVLCRIRPVDNDCHHFYAGRCHGHGPGSRGTGERGLWLHGQGPSHGIAINEGMHECAGEVSAHSTSPS